MLVPFISLVSQSLSHSLFSAASAFPFPFFLFPFLALSVCLLSFSSQICSSLFSSFFPTVLLFFNALLVANCTGQRRNPKGKRSETEAQLLIPLNTSILSPHFCCHFYSYSTCSYIFMSFAIFMLTLCRK